MLQIIVALFTDLFADPCLSWVSLFNINKINIGFHKILFTTQLYVPRESYVVFKLIL